jgi:hypothetical protein
VRLFAYSLRPIERVQRITRSLLQTSTSVKDSSCKQGFRSPPHHTPCRTGEKLPSDPKPLVSDPDVIPQVLQTKSSTPVCSTGVLALLCSSEISPQNPSSRKCGERSLCTLYFHGLGRLAPGTHAACAVFI